MQARTYLGKVRTIFKDGLHDEPLAAAAAQRDLADDVKRQMKG